MDSILITAQEASELARLRKKGEKNATTVRLLKGIAGVVNGKVELNAIEVGGKALDKLAKDKHSIFKFDSGLKEFKKIAFFNGRFYKLVYDNGVTLEIDGIRMHQTKNVSPQQDAENKSKVLKLEKGENLLDICTGLGYSAISEAEHGCKVKTIELDENVLKIARENPFSQKLFGFEKEGKVEIIVGNAFQEIDKLEDEAFDAIQCDPPFYNFAPELYSNEFVSKLSKKLKPKGRLFFYIGNKESKSVGKIFKAVAENLNKHFKCNYLEKERGFICCKK